MFFFYYSFHICEPIFRVGFFWQVYCLFFYPINTLVKETVEGKYTDPLVTLTTKV